MRHIRTLMGSNRKEVKAASQPGEKPVFGRMLKKLMVKLPGFRFSRKMLILMLVICIAGGGIYVVQSWMNNRERTVSASGDYITFNVERGNITQTVTGSAPVTAFERQQVTSVQAGTVSSVAVNEGEVVGEGDLLLELFSGDLNVALEKARLDLLLAEMDLEQMLIPDVEDPEELAVATSRLKVEEANLVLEAKLSLLI